MPSVVVLPTYNEASNLPTLLPAIRAAAPEVTILVVDDGSPDGTADIAAGLGAVVLRRTGQRGLGPAYRDGFVWALQAGMDPIFQMDADFSHDPADLPRLRAALEQGADLALGSRYVRGGGTQNWGLHRRVLSRFGGFYTRLCLGLNVADPTGGFKGWRAALLQRIDPRTLQADGYGFQVEATWRAARLGARITEVPIVFVERRAGASKMSGGIALEAAWRIPALRFRSA